MRSTFVLIIGAAAIVSDPAIAGEWSFTNRYNVGPDIRWWQGASQTATRGMQVVTNYGSDLSFKQSDLFALTFSADSGHLWAQANQIIPVQNYLSFPNARNNSIAYIRKYSADGPLDIFMSGRFDLKINSFIQPYIWTGFNKSQKTTLTRDEVFAFANEKDRDLRGSFGSGNFQELRSGSVFNLSKTLALDVYWKRNFGTEYIPYGYSYNPFGGPSANDRSYTEGDRSITSSLQYSGDRFSWSANYQRTVFDENGYRGYNPFNPESLQTIERWKPGTLRILSGKAEFRPDDHWFVYAEGSYSKQDPNLKAAQYNVYFPGIEFGGVFFLPPHDNPPTPFTQEPRNSNPIKAAGIFGIGYYANPWTFQVQGLYSVDFQNDYLRSEPEFLARRNRVGVEGIVNLRASSMGSLTARFAYLHVNGVPDRQGPCCSISAPAAYDSANIYTVYLTGKLQFAAQ